MLQKMITNDWSFTPSEKVQINAIANQCPFTGGEGVYRARSLAANYELNRYNDESLCAVSIAGPRANKLNNDLVKCFPNPASDLINVIAENQEQTITEIKLNGTDGKMILNKKYSNPRNEVNLDITPLTPGVYMMQILLNNGNLVTKKILKN